MVPPVGGQGDSATCPGDPAGGSRPKPGVIGGECTPLPLIG